MLFPDREPGIESTDSNTNKQINSALIVCRLRIVLISPPANALM